MLIFLIVHHLGSRGLKLIYSLDLTDSSQNCPANLLEVTMHSARACRRAAEFNPPDCDSVIIPTNGVSYSKVVGGIRGYRTQTTVSDGFSTGKGIEKYYMDGLSVSLTYCQSPRKHIWSNASAGVPGSSRYPCPDFNGAAPPSFVGEDYFCASGDEPEFTSDGQNPLLFCKDLSESTVADLELRLCTSTKTNEMVGFD
jgi:hypothetical protein